MQLDRSSPFLPFSAQTSALSSTQHFCTNVQTATKNDICPNPNTLNIAAEHLKSETIWKLDFQVND